MFLVRRSAANVGLGRKVATAALLFSTVTSSLQLGRPKVVSSDDLMAKKSHGTCEKPPGRQLRWGCSHNLADRICCFNRHYAEHSGYWESTSFLKNIERYMKDSGEVTFFDSVSQKPLFVVPNGRSVQDFLNESLAHGWPSFRDEEVVKSNVRILTDGEVVSVDGTHLGHNIPDGAGNRYCINLVSIAGTRDDSHASASAATAPKGL